MRRAIYDDKASLKPGRPHVIGAPCSLGLHKQPHAAELIRICALLKLECRGSSLRMQHTQPHAELGAAPQPAAKAAAVAGYEPHSTLPMAIPMLLCPWSPNRPAAFPATIATLTTSVVRL